MNSNQLLKMTLGMALALPTLSLLLYIGTVKQIWAEDCPVIIDLNGNGRIDITGHTSGQDKIYTLFSVGNYVSFDIDADGIAENIDWIHANTDGILLDLRTPIPADNKINGSHLFANIEYENGFHELSELDNNADGILSGDELAFVALWVDDGDALLEPEEIRQLGEFDIQSISTTFFEETSEYGTRSITSNASTSSGILYVEDVWFLDEEEVPDHDEIIAHILNLFRS